MKKKLFLVLTLLMAVLLLVSCGGGDDTTYYTVEFDSNGSKDYQDRAIEEGHLIKNEPIPTRPGYEFLGWYNGDTRWDFEKDVVTSHVKLTAKWSRLSFTVKFDSAGGSFVESQTVNSADKIQRPTDPTKENHIFTGWFDKDGAEWNFDFDRVTDYMTLTAKWDPCPTFTVTFNSDGGTAIEPQYVVDGNKVTAPKDPTKQNSAFLGWYLGDEKWNFEENAVTKNITLIAKWQTIKTFSVTFDSNGGSDVPTQHVAEGEKAVKPHTPERQQLSVFVGWFLGDTEWNFDTVVTSNITLKAKWINRYLISFDTNGTAESIPSVYVDEGGYIIKPADPSKANSRFVGWFVGDTKWNFATDKVADNLTLTAKWEPIPTYTVTFDSNGGSAVGEQHVLEGGYVSDQGSEREGFRLDGWYVTNGNKEERWDFGKDTVTKKITLKAKWVEIVKVTINVDGVLSTIVIDKGQPIDLKEHEELVEPHKDGYVFRGWKIDDSDDIWDFDKVVNKPITLTANFLVACTVTFDTNGGTAVPPMTVGKGEQIVKPAISKGTKYRLGGWYISGTTIKWNFSDPVTEDMVLKAKWIPTTPADDWTKPND